MRQERLRVLVVGRGAREHALGWAIDKSPRVERVLYAPGNGGMPRRHRRDVQESDLKGIVQLATYEDIDLVVVGPEAPLVAGLVDELTNAGIAAFGPSSVAAILEGSKVFTKMMCKAVNIPTAHWMWTDNPSHADSFIRTWGSLPVIKADGLCAGKGVILPKTLEEALKAADDMLVKKTLRDAGSRIVIEDRLIGNECSVMAFCEGEHAILLPPARDYKRAFDGDKGPNTGGMGAYAPLPDVNEAMLKQIKERIILPTLRYMIARGTPFRGLLYAGIMVTANGPYLLEYNVRFGDPETQVVLPIVLSDIVEYLLATLEPGKLAMLGPVTPYDGAAVCTVLASDGYPGAYETGSPISIHDDAYRNGLLFHAGTERTPGLVTSGGRVLSCVGTGSSIDAARESSLAVAELIKFPGKFHRTDIAA